MVDVISIIQSLLAAALIPLIIGIFLNANSETRDKIIAEKEITNRLVMDRRKHVKNRRR